MSNYTLISVESRKGGVGKTTAALNIGYLLKDKSHVLILDVDITGTSISAIRNSRFWRDDAYLLIGMDGKTMNLLQYFTESYLKGKEIADFSLKEEDGKILVKQDTINVIASELYSEDASLLYDPSLLLENIHIYWLTELINKICTNFAASFDDKKPCVIILDNSPGFVGIGKAVHDILTNVGPLEGKFLTVSSLDTQDLESCLKAIFTINNEYERKLNDVLTPDADSSTGDFYAEVKLSGSTEYGYYKNQPQKVKLPTYQGVVINKVAKEIVEGGSRYDFERLLTPQLQPIYDSLTEGDVTKCMVPFDNVLLTQFYGTLVLRDSSQKPNYRSLNARLGTIESQIHGIEDLSAEELPLDLLRKANGLEATIDSLKGALIACGYEIMASKFNPEWAPTRPLQKLLDVMKRMDYALPSKELYFPQKARMREVMLGYPRLSELIQTLSIQSHILTWFASSVASVACEISLCMPNMAGRGNGVNSHGHVGMYGLKEDWSLSIDVTLVKWVESICDLVRQEGGLEIPALIINEKAGRFDYILSSIIEHKDFIRYFKETVCRLMDVVPDMRILLALIRTITINNEGSYTKDVDFVSFLNRKIITKELTYNQAKERMYDELRDSDYMESYRSVLKTILRNWKLL